MHSLWKYYWIPDDVFIPVARTSVGEMVDRENCKNDDVRQEQNEELPPDLCVEAETISFGEMVDFEIRSHEDDRLGRGFVMRRDLSVEVEAEAEGANPSNDEPVDDRDAPRSSPPSGRSVEEDYCDIYLPKIDPASSNHDDNMGDTRRAGITKARRPMVRRVSRFIKKKKRIGKKLTGTQKIVPAANVEKEREEYMDCRDRPVQDHDSPRISSATELSAEEDYSETIPGPLDVIVPIEANIAEGATEALPDVSKKVEINSTDGFVGVIRGRTRIDTRIISAITFVSLLLFVFLYAHFGGQNLFVDLTCFILLVFFYFYRQGCLDKMNPEWMDFMD